MLGLVSLLTDTSSEMIIPLLPAFVTGVLGGGPLAIGWIVGLADATASVLKLVSGRLSDRIGRYRPLIIAGYALAAIARPLVAAATAVWHVIVVHVTDRVGKGLRTSPRDALIAASVTPSQRGAAFGLHRAMDHVGAVLGPLIAVGLLSLANVQLRTLFWLAAVPGALALVALVFGVREIDARTDAVRAESSTVAPERDLVRVLVPFAVFALGNASDVFLLLKAGEARAPLISLPLLWMALHIVKALTAVPAGWVADRLGYRTVIVLGWSVYAAIYLAFGFAERTAVVAVLFVAYGAYHGLTEGAERALVANLSARGRRGAAFGWYHATTGLVSMAASVGFGAVWAYWSSRAAFLLGAGLAFVAAILLVLTARGNLSGSAAPATSRS